MNRNFSTEIVERYRGVDPKVTCRNITFQVTDDCCLKCSYCYQTHKGHRMMTEETGKAIVDLLFALYHKNDEESVINHHTYGIILDFIGGEPFMNIKTMDAIVEYFMEQCYEYEHIWLTNFRISISSNGLLYFEPEVQAFLDKYADFISFNITIDGPKEVHDSCRVDFDGKGSYDRSMAAWEHWLTTRGIKQVNTKVTIAPENMPQMESIFDFFLGRGCKEINANPIFEHKWTVEEAQEYYKILIKLANRLLQSKDAHSSLFTQYKANPLMSTDTRNWCWGKGTPILTNDGYKPIETLQIGDLVFTHDGTIHPIINITSHMANNVVKLKSSGIFDLICTADHRLFAQPFDYRGNKGVKHWKPYGKYEVSKLKSNDLLHLFQLSSGNIKIDSDIAYLVGRYIGDGWDAREGHSHNICCAFDETDELKAYFEKANIQYTINVNKTVNQFDILHNSEQNNYLHSLLEQCGHLATGKHFPPNILFWNNESKLALLKGYLDADGSFDEKRKYHKLNTVSYQLAEDLLLLLRSLGYTPTCYTNHRAGISAILGRTVNIHDRYEIYFYDDPEKAKFVKLLDGKLWTSHISIIPEPPQIVYNITVDTNHSYIAGGLVSSNCGGTSAMLAFDPDGNAYPCLRYMESSLGTARKPIIIGDCNGIYNTPEYKAIYDDMQKVTRQSQSTEECINCPVAQGCAWCFPAGTKINTPSGLKNIENLHIYDYVIDMNGDIQMITANTGRLANDLVTVRATGFMPINVTSEHPFYCRPVIKRVNNRPVYGDPQWIVAKDLKVSDRIALFIPQLGDKEIDSCFAYVIGRYIGDGWKTKSNRITHPYRYYICTAFDEQEEFESFLNQSGIKYTKTKNRTVTEYNLNITDNEYMVKLLDDCGENAKTKHIPREVWSWNKKSVEALLKGYFDADGSIQDDVQRFTSVSYELILNICELVRAVYHKAPHITFRKSPGKTIIEGREVNNSDSYEGRFLLAEPKKHFYEYDEQNNIIWTNIKSGPEPLKEVYVYNLTVENTHSYIANGAIVHNCSAWNYQETGSYNKRSTNICWMHRAEALANVYYWNIYYRNNKISKRQPLYLPRDIATKIISNEEYDKLYGMSLY